MDLGANQQINFSLNENYSKTGYLSSDDNTQIFYRHYAPENPQATVLIIHGFGEHSGRYAHVIDELLATNFEVFCIDLRGHGRSKGSRGDIKTFTNYEEDVDALISYAKSMQGPKRKFFIVAHSMGALVALSLLAHTKHHVDGVVLSSPLFALSLPVPLWKRLLGRCLGLIAPSLSLKSEISGSQLSSDTHFASAYDKDPLVLKSLSVRAFMQIVKKLRDSKDIKIKQPFFMQVAEKDFVVDSKAATDWFESLGSKKKDQSLKIYPEFLHEIYNESRRNEPIFDAIEWIKNRL